LAYTTVLTAMQRLEQAGWLRHRLEGKKNVYTPTRTRQQAGIKSVRTFIKQMYENGELEAVPNGDAVFYTDLLGVTDTIQEAGRYALRWPGWCDFWRPLKKFGFLSDKSLEGLDCQVNPHQFLSNLMAPQLQYRDDEKDIVAMYNIFEGIKDGAKKSIINSLMIERDLNTGLFAMSIGVGYTASIVAQMIGNRQIKEKGVLNPAIHVPYTLFMTELSKRGIEVKDKIIHEA